MRKGIGPNALGSPAKQMNFKKAAKKARKHAVAVDCLKYVS